MEDENLISVYLKLLAILECPVCLEYLTKPVALCREGHAVCSKCKSNVSSCPMCRNAFTGTRGVIIDQVIETLLYPCYKMGCGSFLKRTEAENHDQNCILEIASDKQVVLHNNLLKNIEENFASFIVQPEIIKETRTVGTVTGKIKMADALVQTAIPFSAKIQTSPMKGLKSSKPSGTSRSFTDQPRTGFSPGISISSTDDFQKLPVGFINSVKDPDSSKLAFSLPQKSSFGQSSFTVAPNPLKNSSNDLNNISNSKVSTGFKFSVDESQNVRGFWNGANAYEQMSQPFVFSSTQEPISGIGSRGSSKKPSTNLVIKSGSHSLGECIPVAANDPSVSDQNKLKNNKSAVASNGEVNVNIPSTSSSSLFTFTPVTVNCNEISQNEILHSVSPFNFSFNAAESQRQSSSSKIKPSTNINLNSTLLNRVTANNNEPFDSRSSLLPSNTKKRPTTNLCSVTTSA